MNSEISNKYRWYVLFVLTGVYVFNFIDRQILVIIQESIKADLGLSDTQLGLLTGLAFAAFYVTLGLPIARYADKNNRKNIVSIALVTWSAMTAISGLVTNYFQLLMARIGVGIGEAGGSPPSHSMISDYFPPEKRATALSVYSTGIYIGVLLGFVVGGVIDARYGWRVAFYCLGIPGIIYAALVFFTVREPIKGMSDPTPLKEDDSTSFAQVVKHLFKKKTFVYASIGCGLTAFMQYGVGNFMPPFLMRIHNLDVATIGIWLGLSAGVGGATGTFLGGYLADKLRNRNLRWYFWVPILAGVVNFLPSIIKIFSGNSTAVLISTVFTSALTAFYLGPMLAVTHSLVTAKMRAVASAVLFFILNFIGLGLGPLFIGALSDMLNPIYGNYSLRWAFTSIFVVGIAAMTSFYLASKHYEREINS